MEALRGCCYGVYCIVDFTQQRLRLLLLHPAGVLCMHCCWHCLWCTFWRLSHLDSRLLGMLLWIPSPSHCSRLLSRCTLRIRSGQT